MTDQRGGWVVVVGAAEVSEEAEEGVTVVVADVEVDVEEVEVGIEAVVEDAVASGDKQPVIMISIIKLLILISVLTAKKNTSLLILKPVLLVFIVK
jgi:hypothetical protein